tara:strand:+ start:262 stop:1077 length:816 start_codon:yes stop_codon:yes gene_type:complete
MNLDDIKARGLILIGCGKMGSAMLAGWLDSGIPASSIWISDPQPSAWLSATGVNLNKNLPDNPAVCIIAVKPQIIFEAVSHLNGYQQSKTLFISIAAGITLKQLEQAISSDSKIIRAMPNTPSAVGKGITALIGNSAAKNEHILISKILLEKISEVVELEHEDQMDIVTGLSGSGPAYVFYLIESLTNAGIELGLSKEKALHLAKATVAGSGALAMSSADNPSVLRENVTSPNGTTKAGLEILMDKKYGLRPLIKSTVEAAAKRSKELGNG